MTQFLPPLLLACALFTGFSDENKSPDAIPSPPVPEKSIPAPVYGSPQENRVTVPGARTADQIHGFAKIIDGQLPMILDELKNVAKSSEREVVEKGLTFRFPAREISGSLGANKVFLFGVSGKLTADDTTPDPAWIAVGRSRDGKGWVHQDSTGKTTEVAAGSSGVVFLDVPFMKGTTLVAVTNHDAVHLERLYTTDNPRPDVPATVKTFLMWIKQGEQPLVLPALERGAGF
jgi:hypothetical protein